MITWDDHIRFTPKTKKKFGRIKRRLRRHKLTSVLSYCIAFPTNPENKLDIYNMGELLFKRYEEYDDEIHIIGLAESRDAAIELAADIISEVYERTDSFDIQKYFKDYLKDE
ncbi:MAG: hypothetical protein K6G45_12130 [Lachnospiraceae bacterium]|nr:hypothetical protein [Lachnospiraceae bacterium]MCR5769213.1 hypothetical protein [Lachnospiraceae bacterium]